MSVKPDPELKDIIAALEWETRLPTPEEYDDFGNYTKFFGIVKRYSRETGEPYYIFDEINLMKDQHYSAGGSCFTHFLHEGDYVEVIAWIQMRTTLNLEDILKFERVKSFTVLNKQPKPASDNKKDTSKDLNLNLTNELI